MIEKCNFMYYNKKKFLFYFLKSLVSTFTHWLKQCHMNFRNKLLIYPHEPAKITFSRAASRVDEKTKRSTITR